MQLLMVRECAVVLVVVVVVLAVPIPQLVLSIISNFRAPEGACLPRTRKILPMSDSGIFSKRTDARILRMGRGLLLGLGLGLGSLCS